MIGNDYYQCYKCNNKLLKSNKMLHDLRCTEENPATYENILSQQLSSETNSENQYYNPSTSPSSLSSNRMSIKNEDGTMIDIKKEKGMFGKEQLVEIKYDSEGNILSRKKADSISFNDNRFDYQDVPESYDYNINNNYQEEIIVNNNIKEDIVYREPIEQIVYEAPPKYDPNVTINQPIEETVIKSNINISQNELNDIIRKTMGGNVNQNNNNNSYQFNNNQIYNNYNNFGFGQANNDNIFRQSNNNFMEENFNINYDLNNDLNNYDVLRRTAGIGSHF